MCCEGQVDSVNSTLGKALGGATGEKGRRDWVWRGEGSVVVWRVRWTSSIPHLAGRWGEPQVGKTEGREEGVGFEGKEGKRCAVEGQVDSVNSTLGNALRGSHRWGMGKGMEGEGEGEKGRGLRVEGERGKR